MAEKEIVLMKGNEAIAHAAIRCGADGYFGYPITPQSEVLETLAEQKPWETTGMVVLQAESEVASINMVYGGAGAGKRVLTSSSSPGVSLMQEGISYIAGAELPCLRDLVLSNPAKQTISRQSKVVDTETIASLYWLRLQYRRWQISLTSRSNWHSNTATRP